MESRQKFTYFLFGAVSAMVMQILVTLVALPNVNARSNEQVIAFDTVRVRSLHPLSVGR